MEEARAVATLNDLPNELLERIVPDLKPKTISALKLVNRRFYGLFSDDLYFKAYLRCPERYYLCVMKCERSSGKHIVDEIKSGALGKWRGYLTLENLYLENMRCGRSTGCDVVRLPSMSDDFDGFCVDGVRWHDLVDEDNERWLLSLRQDGSIVLVNITNGPKVHVEREMYGIATECVRLLNAQVLCISYNMRHVVVLDIVYDGNDVSLRYCFDFAFDTLDFKWIPVSGKCETSQARRNLFVTFRVYPEIDGMLHFRDLKTGNLLENICLWDYECLKHFGDLPSEYIDLKFNKCVEYPNICMKIADKRSGVTVICSLDVDKSQPNLFVVNSNQSLIKCSITDNVAYTFTCEFDRQDGVDSVTVHSFPLKKHLDIEQLHLHKPLFHFRCKGMFDADFCTPEKFAFIDPEVHNKVHVITISNCYVNDVQIDLNIDLDYKTCLRLVGNTLIYTSGKSEHIFSVDVTQAAAGGKVVNWKNKLWLENITCSDPWPIRSMDLTKLIFYDRNEVTGMVDLIVFYF